MIESSLCGDFYRVADVDAEMEKRNAMIRELCDALAEAADDSRNSCVQWCMTQAQEPGKCNCGAQVTAQQYDALVAHARAMEGK